MQWMLLSSARRQGLRFPRLKEGGGFKMDVKVEFTEGYEKRFTEACCRMLAKRNQQLIPPAIKAERKERQGESIKC